MNIKTIAAALLVAAAASAHADGTLFLMSNKAGGHIRLTDMKGNCGKNKLMVYATREDGSQTSTGCWTYNEDDQMVFIVWDSDGKLGSYPSASFTVTPYGKRTLGNKE